MSKQSTNGNYFNRDNGTDAITNAPGAASSLTLSCWYYASAFGNVHQPISIGTNDFDFLMVIEVDTGGNVRAYVAKSSTGQTHNTASAALATTTWVHLAATWDGTTVRLYVNGAEAANVVGTITSQPAITYMEQGYVASGGDALTMQDLTYWSAALSADQVRELSVGRLPKRRGNLVAHWPLFVKSGDTLDYSGNNNHGKQNGTVADGTVDAPVGWGSPSPRRIYVPTSTVSFSSGTSTSTTAATGTLRVRLLYNSNSAVSTTSATGTLRVNVKYTSNTATSTTSAAATLAARKTTAGTSTSTTDATATLNVRKTTAGASTTTTSATAQLHASRQFAGTSTTPSAGSGTLHVKQFFSGGVATSGTSATGTFGARLLAAGQAVTTSSAVGLLASREEMAGACTTTSSATCADFTSFGDAMFDSGTSTTTTAATGTMNVTAGFTSGASTTTTAAVGGLVGHPTFAAASTTTTAAAGTLHVVKEFTAGICASHTRARGALSGGAEAAGGRSYLDQKRRFGAIGVRRKTR